MSTKQNSKSFHKYIKQAYIYMYRYVKKYLFQIKKIVLVFKNYK